MTENIVLGPGMSGTWDERHFQHVESPVPDKTRNPYHQGWKAGIIVYQGIFPACKLFHDCFSRNFVLKQGMKKPGLSGLQEKRG